MRFKIVICTFVGLTVAGCAGEPPKTAKPPPESTRTNELSVLAGPGPYNWDCNEQTGMYDAQVAPAVAKHIQVTGNIHVVDMHPGSKWGSAVTIGFMDKKIGEGVGFQLLAYQYEPELIKFLISGDGRPGNTTVFASQPYKESDIRFTAEIESGIVHVSAGGISVKSDSPRTDLNRVSLLCTGAHAIFENIAVTVLP